MSARGGGVLPRLFGLLLLLFSLIVGWLWLDYRNFADAPLSLPPNGWRYQVERGTGLAALADDLTAQGILRHPWYLRLLGYQTGLQTQIKAGEYRFASGLTGMGLLRLLAEGSNVHYSLTLIEGWTFEQMLGHIRRQPFVRAEPDGQDASALMQRLGSNIDHPEGMFYPDTYRFLKGVGDFEVLQRSYLRMQEILQQEWAERQEGLPLETAYQALTLASIIEKETGVPQERSLIAAVFVNRLRRNMLLQTDPTVIYGLGDAFDGNLTRAHLRQDTPYNTYRNGGLPPTPISMPGREAIHAALHPQTSKAVYFVARGDGTHQFSETLQEHNRAVARFQKKR
jgi:UPF0755 protein